jgi:hypothetical protein
VSEATAPITITIPEFIYKTGTEMATGLQTALNAKMVAWIGGGVINDFTVAFSAATNTVTLGYSVAAPGGVAAQSPILVLTTIFTEGGISYDSSRIWGTTSSVQAGLTVVGSFQLAYASRAVGSTLPNYVDLQTLQVIRLHSNVAKRYFAKRGPAAATPAQRILSLTDILFEIPVDTPMGATLVWQPSDNRFMQDIASNFDELRLTLTDNKDTIIQFTNAAEINFTFAIEREIIVPDNEERIKALSDYNRFKSY